MFGKTKLVISRSNRFQPDLESLDQRIVPAKTTHWNSTGVWSNGTPTTNDIVIIDTGSVNCNITSASFASFVASPAYNGTITFSSSLTIPDVTTGTLNTITFPQTSDSLTITHQCTLNGTISKGYIRDQATVNSSVDVSCTFTNGSYLVVDTGVTANVDTVTFTAASSNGYGIWNKGYLNLIGGGSINGWTNGNGDKENYLNNASGATTEVVAGFSSSLYTIYSYIQNSGLVYVPNGKSLGVYSRDNSTSNESYNGGTGSELRVAGTGSITCTYYLYISGSGFLSALSSGGVVQSATVDALGVYFVGTSGLQFDSSNGCESITSTSDWYFGANTYINATVDSNGITSLTGATVTVNATGTSYNLTKVGSFPHQPATWGAITATTSYVGDFASYTGLGTWTRTAGANSVLIDKP